MPTDLRDSMYFTSRSCKNEGIIRHILFIDYSGIHHHHLALELNQIRNNGLEAETPSKVPHPLLHGSHLSPGTPIPNTARELDSFLFQ